MSSLCLTRHCLILSEVMKSVVIKLTRIIERLAVLVPLALIGSLSH
jgi:hypothetical protein